MDITCPHCGSVNVEVKRIVDILFYKCLDCGKLFVEKPSRKSNDKKEEEEKT